ncbi:hypothetical protein BH23ACT6_BH23ACT6_23700 [soil metagenome]
MASTSIPRHADASTEALQSVREALPGPADEDLIEHRPDEDPQEDLQQPLHDPWWAGGGAAGGV